MAHPRKYFSLQIFHLNILTVEGVIVLLGVILNYPSLRESIRVTHLSINCMSLVVVKEPELVQRLPSPL